MPTTSIGRPGFLSTSKTVVRDVGTLQVLIGGLMAVPLFVSLLYQEWYSSLAFLIAAGITALAGGAAYKLCEDAPGPKRHHAMIENMGTHGGENALYVPDVEEHTVASLAKSEAESVESILLPVGTGPHAALAAEAARAVARASGASITVLHVISPTASAETRANGEDLLKFAAYVLGSEVAVETELKEASDTTDTIVQEAKTYDFVSIGFPEQKSRLKQLVFGSVQETLSELRGTTVLMSRDSNRTMRSLYYRWKRGITSAEDDGDSGN